MAVLVYLDRPRLAVVAIARRCGLERDRAPARILPRTRRSQLPEAARGRAGQWPRRADQELTACKVRLHPSSDLWDLKRDSLYLTHATGTLRGQLRAVGGERRTSRQSARAAQRVRFEVRSAGFR